MHVCDKVAPDISTPAPTGKTRAHILVVEDSLINQTMVMIILKKNGYSVDAVPNGIAAIATLRKISYDLVLMDCQMPKMDGFDATLNIRNKDSGVLDNAIPIIAVTAHAAKEDQAKCFLVGMNAFIAKPIKAAELLAEIERLLNAKRD
jgi:CheY-like chemotaxis protein